jgi:hypothetical protein
LSWRFSNATNVTQLSKGNEELLYYFLTRREPAGLPTFTAMSSRIVLDSCVAVLGANTTIPIVPAVASDIVLPGSGATIAAEAEGLMRLITPDTANGFWDVESSTSFFDW